MFVEVTLTRSLGGGKCYMNIDLIARLGPETEHGTELWFLSGNVLTVEEDLEYFHSALLESTFEPVDTNASTDQ